jgi:hypothetical protein
VVDVTPVKLAVLDFFDLVLGVGTATEDLGAFPAIRVDPACCVYPNIEDLASVKSLSHEVAACGREDRHCPGARSYWSG